jgi:deferrochelatase/peroxidase EfeB
VNERRSPEPGHVSRRSFLGGAAGTVAAGVAGAAGVTGGALLGTEPAVAAGDGAPSPVYVPFHGEHQTGITSLAPAAGLMAAFNLQAGDRAELVETFRALTDETKRLMEGEPYDERDSAYPPLYSGTVGNPPPPADLSVIVSVGASLFDDRFGLADRKPRELVAMPFIANDRLDPAITHGDLLLSISADSPDACVFALRQLMRRTRGALVLHWMLDGFNRHDRSGPAGPGQAPVRNLMGFKDGTANLDFSNAALMDRHVWVGGDDAEPAWADGGSYQAVRIIRMLVEFWDRTPLAEQEAIIGRVKKSGAPMNGTEESDLPDYTDDADGDVTPLDAHIRLANPRTPETADSLILRRGFSYSRGFDGAGRLDQGLAFVSFQRSLERGFLAVQNRLNGEPLEEYILPVGGGFFFALPGAPRGRYLGQSLVST